ncbi:Dolichyl-diphosphooligosaccharide--protein glycosyltransferase subunit [Nymphaea thermarum]|nr:Dolichyl-diphosphooligosaccharide--protein glycosyltransferase subunit [Nymphaea thermarum]
MRTVLAVSVIPFPVSRQAYSHTVGESGRVRASVVESGTSWTNVDSGQGAFDALEKHYSPEKKFKFSKFFHLFLPVTARERVFLPVPQLARRAPLSSCCREVWAAPASSFSSSHTQNSNSLFFNSLRSRGFNLEFRLSDYSNLVLQRYGQYLYDGLVLFSPSAQRLGRSLLDFVDSGHDLILAANVGASHRIRDIATECGADFDEILKVLTASPSAYSANPNTKLSSPPISLVFVVQAFNWESSKNSQGWYHVLKNSVPQMAEAGVTHVWLPPPSQSASPEVQMDKP